jgi:hypothetical protein
MMHLQEVIKFIRAALECSVYIAPKDYGLTTGELFEAGSRAGFQEGEISDAARQASTSYFGKDRFLPDQPTVMAMTSFVFPANPEYRNFKALDLVVSNLRASVKALGAAQASLDRSVIVERAFAQGIGRNDIEAAITILVMSGTLVEKEGSLSFARGREGYSPPSLSAVLRNQTTQQNDVRMRAYAIVKDIIERRSDGRPSHAEPLDAFVEALDKLGYGPFRLWWQRIVAELRQADTKSVSVSVSVLAGALVEGALTFVVAHARELGLGVLGSKTFEGKPSTWSINDLVASAAAGGDSAILDPALRHRADELIRARQRIHAGRMLSEFPGGPPDLLPEAGRDAKTTAELVVRRVLDWLEKYPPKT